MNYVALKMLVGDRGKYLAIILGVLAASMLITQQMAIFVGIMSRTFSFITDVGQPQIWVTDPMVQHVDDTKPMQDTQLYRVRGVPGVQWAVPMFKGTMRARLAGGNFQTCAVVGLDDATLIGGPPVMVQGKLENLRQANGVIVDSVGAADKLGRHLPDGSIVPLKIGDELELNDHRAVVVGICRVTRNFQSQPVIYTTYTRATSFAPQERKLLTFILAGIKPGEDVQQVCQRITAQTQLSARTQDDFKKLTYIYYMKNTGIPINIGIGVLMSLGVGTAVSGLMFYNFTMENIRHFGAFKAMGAGNGLLLRMILIQAVLVGVIGYGMGVGAASMVGFLARNTEMAFRLPWQALMITAGAVVMICIAASIISIRKVMLLEPAIVFKS